MCVHLNLQISKIKHFRAIQVKFQISNRILLGDLGKILYTALLGDSSKITKLINKIIIIKKKTEKEKKKKNGCSGTISNFQHNVYVRSFKISKF